MEQPHSQLVVAEWVIKTAQELRSRPVCLWPDALGLQLNFCYFVGEILVAVQPQTMLLCREGIES